MPLTLDEAHKVIAGAQARAREMGIRITVAIVDEGGLLQALSRMDGAPPLSAQIAESKANGAALMLRDGAALGAMYKERPGFFAVVDKLARMPVVPGPGSILVQRGGATLGAVGVSGGKPEQDVECAEAGLKTL